MATRISVDIDLLSCGYCAAETVDNPVDNFGDKERALPPAATMAACRLLPCTKEMAVTSAEEAAAGVSRETEVQ
jgi:hypothetical protein